MNGYQDRKRIQTKACLRDLRQIDRKQGHRGILSSLTHTR